MTSSLDKIDNNIIYNAAQLDWPLKQLVAQSLTAADQTPHLAEKRSKYEQAFQAICQYAQENRNEQNTPEVIKLLTELFHAYASKTCYAQASEVTDQNGKSVDSEEGFRKSARLMELSLCMQLSNMNLLDFSYNYTNFDSLADLLGSLEINIDQQGLFFPLVSQINIDADALVQNAEQHQCRNMLTQTLIHMTYAHQNIAALRENPAKNIHTQYQPLTEKVIGRETESQKRELCGYLYNRCSFLVDLTNPGDAIKKVLSYNPVTNLLKEAYPEDHPDYISRLAQINNITGLIFMKAGMPLPYAQSFFHKAFQLRSILADKFDDENKKFEQEYLMSNLRTSLIHCIIHTLPFDRAALTLHKEALEAFLNKMNEKGDMHSYRGSYLDAIANAKNALA